MSSVIIAVALGLVGGCVYGLLLVRSSRIKRSFISAQQTPVRLIMHFAKASILRLLFFLVLGSIVLRYLPQHFILMLGIFIGSLWMTIVITRKGDRLWQGLP